MVDELLQTNRLVLSRLSYDDSEFIFELVNEDSFKRFVGDKKVNSLGDAHDYLAKGPIGSYEQHGFGMFLVRDRENDEPLGICGLVKREQFEDPDVGFAFLRRHWARGYALEASKAVVEYGQSQLGLRRLIAIVDPANAASVRLIEKLDFIYERMVRMDGDEHDICLYGLEVA